MGSVGHQLLEKMGSPFEVYVTAATAERQTGLFKFWTQLDPEGLDKVEEQVTQFQCLAKETPSPPPDTLEEGNLCIAKYLEDGRWYRARIDSVTGNDVIAYFIDYGNTEIIPRSLVRTREVIGHAVFAVPAQATQCVLAEVMAVMQHRNLKIGTHGFLKSILVDQTYTGDVQRLTEDGLEVKLFTESGDSIADKFIREEFGVPRGPGIAISTSAPASASASAASQDQTPKGLAQTSLAVGSCENFYVSNVNSLGQFWVQQSSLTAVLDGLMDRISSQYDGLAPQERGLRAVEVGTACIAKFSEDGVNYRAKVTEIHSPQQCTVQFVDFGNAEVKDATSLKTIAEDLLRQPAIAVECLLSGINLDSCTPQAVERFDEMTAEKELYGKVVGMKGNVYCVLLVDSQDDKNTDIVSTLVKEGVVTRGVEHFTYPPYATPPKTGAQSAFCNGGGDSGAPKAYAEPAVTRGSKVVVEIIAVRGISDFSCQLMKDADAFNVMMDKIQSDYSSSSFGGVKSPKVGQPCCVSFSEDSCWYRARVVSLQGNTASVQYVDYGNGEVVELSKLKQLKAEYLSLPLQCIDCALDGVPRLEDAEADKATEWLDQRTEENLVATVTGVQDGKFLVVVKSEASGVVLNEEIKKILPRQTQAAKQTPPRPKPQQELYQPVQKQPPKSPPQAPPTPAPAAEKVSWSQVKLGSTEDKVYLSYVEAPSKFFCQLVSQEAKLNALMDEINGQSNQSTMKQIQGGCVGTACLAQFSEDKSWYRSVIQAQKVGCYRVCFVDYGNEEDVPLENVREITAELMGLPQQAVSCSLSGWDAAWKEEKVTLHMRTLAASVESFRLTIRETKGVPVVQLKWQGKDMLKELKGIRESIPKEVKQPQAATPPRQKEKAVDSTPTFTIPSAVESVKIGGSVMMAASVAKGPTKFFSQLCSEYDKLQALVSQMNDYYANSSSKKDSLSAPVPGLICAAKSSSDGSWYRAKILHLKASDKIKVRFVDYGDNDVLPVASLRVLAPKFRSLPTQAIKCRLSGVMMKFAAMSLDQEVAVVVKAKEEGKLEVEYQDEALRTKVQEIFGPVASAGKAAAPAQPQGYTKPMNLVGSEHDVYVSHVDSLAKFYVQMCRSSNDIDVLQQQLSTAYSSDPGQSPSTPAVGAPCCAKFTEDGDWYRAVVKSKPTPDRAIVQFVDFGNSEEQPVSNLRALKEEFLGQTTGAVECSLQGIGSSSEDASNKFFDLTVDKSLKCRLTGAGEPYQARFPELQAELKGLMEVVTPKPQSAPIPCLQSLKAGVKEEMFVSHVDSPATFWCQLVRQESTLNSLMDSIDAHYSSLSADEGKMAQPEIGASCIAQFADDEGWYRARITQVTPDSCTVIFIDYGNSDVVSRSLIKEIKDEFLTVDQQAVLCSLGGVGSVDAAWSSEACDSFAGLTGEKKLLAEVLDVDAKTSSHQVTLLDLGMSLGQSLVESGHAKAIPTTAKSNRFASESDEPLEYLAGFQNLSIIPGTSEKVYVTVVNSLHEFYCQFAARTTEDLDPMSEKLQGEAETLPDDLSGNLRGAACIAKFPEDEQWYRASITAEKGEDLQVFFVDYGNRETIPRSQVKAMTDTFSSLPAQTVKCALARVPESSACNDAAVAEFENQVLESEALVSEFIGRKGDTWMLRLLNDGRPVAEALGVELTDEKQEPSASDEKRPSDRLAYSWPSLEPRQVLEVFVNAVSNPEDFWCQLSKSEDDLNILMDNIQSHLSPMGDNPNPNDLHLRPGQACLAVSSQDSAWYRSEVKEVTEDTVKVLFVDTGKTETVQRVKVRRMEEEFLSLPRQAFRCQLAGVTPKGDSWDRDASDALRKLTADHSIFADILKIEKDEDGGLGCVTVTLKDGSLSVADLLTAKGHAEEAGIRESPEEDFADASIIKTAVWEGPTYKQSSLGSEEKQDVVILSVTGPTEFYCRLLESELSGMPSRIRSDVDRHISELIGQSRLEPTQKMPCLAKCQDGTWKRAEILHVLGNDRVKVFLVDDALIRLVDVSDLQLITSSLLALTPQAIGCSFETAPSGFSWSEADSSVFKALIEGNTLQAQSVDGGVALFIEEDSVMQTVMQEAESRKAEEEQSTLETVDETDGPTPDALPQGDEPFTSGVDLPASFKQAFTPLELEVNHEVTLCLVTVDSPEEITCQITHTDQKVLDIEQRMTELYGAESEDPGDPDWTPQVGEPCAARHSQYEDWYRATVVSIDEEGVDVYYADYGGKDKVQPESIRELINDLKDLPAQAMRFSLSKPLMPVEMWNKKTKALLEGQEAEHDLRAKVLEVRELITSIELNEDDHTFLTSLVDQSQTASLNNEDGEEEDSDGEFFDTVDQAEASYEMEDIDEALKSFSVEDEAPLQGDDEFKGSVAKVVDALFEKASQQAMADLTDLKPDTVVEDTTEDSLQTEGEKQVPSAEAPEEPQAPLGSRMISMKDIIDQFVDHTLQNLNKDCPDDGKQQSEGQESEEDLTEEESDEENADVGNEDAINGEVDEFEDASSESKEGISKVDGGVDHRDSELAEDGQSCQDTEDPADSDENVAIENSSSDEEEDETLNEEDHVQDEEADSEKTEGQVSDEATPQLDTSGQPTPAVDSDPMPASDGASVSEKAVETPDEGDQFQDSKTEPLETEPLDAEPLDAEPLDAEPLDAEPLDAEPLDAEPLDAEPLDAEPLDAEPLDAEPLDTEPLETEQVAHDEAASQPSVADIKPDSEEAATEGEAAKAGATHEDAEMDDDQSPDSETCRAGEEVQEASAGDVDGVTAGQEEADIPERRDLVETEPVPDQATEESPGEGCSSETSPEAGTGVESQI